MKIVLATPMPLGQLSPYRELTIPEGTDEVRLAIVESYDGPEIEYACYANGEKIGDKP